MKFRIHFTNNKRGIPFNYQHALCGIFHSWMGKNDLHGKLSLYSLGGLYSPVTNVKNGRLYFPNGAAWDIGIAESRVAEQLISGLLLYEFDFFDMKIRSVDRLEVPVFDSEKTRFLASSPVCVRKETTYGQKTYLTFKDLESTEALTRVFKTKVEASQYRDLWSEDTKVFFDSAYPKPKTKLIDIKGIKNRANLCPVYVKGHPKLQEFAWLVGAGELTGVGFGSLNVG